MKHLFLTAVLMIMSIAMAPTVGDLVSPSPSPTLTATITPSITLTNTPTDTSTPTLTPTPTITPTPTPTQWTSIKDFDPNDHVGWKVNCENDDIRDGYRLPEEWSGGYCVPGMITDDAWLYRSPRQFFGLMSSYAPWVMEAQIIYRGLDPDEVRGVALMSCSDIGRTVWLRRPEVGTWEGPFVAVDCSQKNHMYYHEVGMGLVVEIGHRTVIEWGEYRRDRIDVHLGSNPPDEWSGVYYPAWWVFNKMEFDPPVGWSKPTLIEPTATTTATAIAVLTPTEGYVTFPISSPRYETIELRIFIK